MGCWGYAELRLPDWRQVVAYVHACGGALIVRKDDEPATILERLKVYHELTEPLVDFYRERGKLVVVEGQEEVADTTRLLLEKLGVSL